MESMGERMVKAVYLSGITASGVHGRQDVQSCVDAWTRREVVERSSDASRCAPFLQGAVEGS
jgi:hypothetical protein